MPRALHGFGRRPGRRLQGDAGEQGYDYVMCLEAVFRRLAETQSGKTWLPGAAVVPLFNAVLGRGFASARRRRECGGTTMDAAKGFVAFAARKGRRPIGRLENKSETPSRSRRLG